ncbi:MAG: CoA transferase subunit A [Candidatus Saccharibacteria bacterium]
MKYSYNQEALKNLQIEDTSKLDRLVDFESARLAHQKKDHSRKDKRISLKEAVSEYVSDGDTICSGAFAYVRNAIQADWEIIRQGKKHLTHIGSPNTMQSFFVCAGLTDSVHASYTGAEMRGIDKAFNNNYKKGRVNILSEWSHGAMGQGFKAAQLGCPGVFSKQMLGSDMIKYNPFVKVVQNPGREDNDPVVFIPALYPDVAFIHCQWADKAGNARIFGPAVNDVAVAAATRKLVITAEEIVSEDDIRNNNNGVIIPFMYVDAVVELPYGGVPGNVPGYYYWSREWWEWVFRIAMLDDEHMQSFFDYWIYGCKDQYEFVDKLGGSKWLAESKRLTKAAEGGMELDGVDYDYTEVFAKFE